MADKGLTSSGLDAAQDLLKELSVLTGTNSGCAFVADSPRRPTFGAKEAPTHEQLIGYLAEQGRDIRANQDDVNKTGELILKDVAKHLKLTGRRRMGKDGVRPPERTTDEKALRGLAAGLRKGGRLIGTRMLERIEGQRTSSGGTAEKVGDRYAKRRAKWYNVGEGYVYVASGQLYTALSNGRVRVFLKDANAARLLANING